MENCFSSEILNELFHCDTDGCLFTTEYYDIEYKLNLNISYDLLKTMNGLANNKGGYIICGIEPFSRKMMGLSEDKINFYRSNIDSEEMRGKILSSCQPNMEYKHYLHNVGTTKFVIFYIPESKNKPHVFMNAGEDIVSGDIYYRYNDSIKKIQYAELSEIIESKRLKEQEKWMKFLGEIAKIGLDNVLIIDAKNGKMITSDNYSDGIVLDENILSKFKLIKEGQFNEISGAPTLRIIGNIAFQTQSGKFELSTDISTALDINKTHPYRATDIFNKMVKENVKTKDNKFLKDGKITYYRVIFFIQNNKLNVGNQNMYYNKAGNTRTYSQKVYDEVKTAFENMTLSEIETYKLIKMNTNYGVHPKSWTKI